MSGEGRILDPADRDDLATWHRLWEESTHQLPFAHPGVAGPLGEGAGRLLAVTMQWQDSSVLYPLILRDAPGGLRDVISPYGYGGPLVSGDAPADELAAQFWAYFEEWAREQRVVSEFARLSLFDDVLPHPGRLRERNPNLVREIEPDREALWAASSSKVRQNARRALRADLTVRFVEDASMIEDFHSVYTGTMERLDSASWYRFDVPFFSALHDGVPDRLLYVTAERDGRPISIDLMLLGRDTAYYFLGGTEMEASRDRPNDLVKMSVMEWLSDHGYRWYVLGGGLTSGDGLERYKRGFAPKGERMFRTAERVLDAGLYDRLVAERRAEAADARRAFDEESAFFPLYRAPLREPLDLLEAAGATS